MRIRSLRFRLLAAAAVSVSLALIAAAFGLVLLFEHHVERRLDQELETDLRQLIARIQLDSDGRIHAGRIAGAAAPITPLGSCYADLVPSPDGRWLLAIEERPRSDGEPENRLIAIELAASGRPAGVEAVGEPRVIASGHDFYASPTWAPDGERLAYLAWDHPNMPWNGTLLEVVQWSEDGPASDARGVAGGPRESLFQPRFARDGTLFVVSDRSGWWNLLRIGDSGPIPIHSERAELGSPQWVFGMSRWAFLGAGEILASATREGRDVLLQIEIESGQSTPAGHRNP